MHALTRWFQAEYWPAHGHWYDGAVWGNVFVIPIAAVLGALLWPPLRRRIRRFAQARVGPLHERLEELHAQRERHHSEQMARLGEIHASVIRGHLEQAAPKPAARKPPAAKPPAPKKRRS